MYSQMIETYEKVLNSNNSSDAQKQSATEEIEKINNTKNSIMICENLIKTKGFENSVIFVNKKRQKNKPFLLGRIFSHFSNIFSYFLIS